MVNQIQQEGLAHYFRDIRGIRERWLGFFVLGLLLIALGFLAISTAVYTTLFTVVIFGLVLVVGGIVQTVEAFMVKNWSGFFFALLVGILYLLTGLLAIGRPSVSAVALTLLLAAFFLVSGLFKMISAAWTRFDHWGWVFFNGLVTFILGWLIYAEWPVSGLWVIGLFLGIDLILAGITWVALSLKARSAYS